MIVLDTMLGLPKTLNAKLLCGKLQYVQKVRLCIWDTNVVFYPILRMRKKSKLRNLRTFLAGKMVTLLAQDDQIKKVPSNTIFVEYKAQVELYTVEYKYCLKKL